MVRLSDLPVSYSVVHLMPLQYPKVLWIEVYIHTILHWHSRKGLQDSQDTVGCNCLCSAALPGCSLSTSSSCTGRRRRRSLLCSNRSTCHWTCKCYSLRCISHIQHVIMGVFEHTRCETRPRILIRAVLLRETVLCHASTSHQWKD